MEGTQAGTIYVLNGTNGAAVWSAATTGQVIGSPVTADLTGGGYQDVIVPTTDGIDIFDGRSGAEVATLATGYGVPELAARDRRPRRPHRHHGRGLQQRGGGRHGVHRALGDRRHQRLRVERRTRQARGRSSTTTRS